MMYLTKGEMCIGYKGYSNLTKRSVLNSFLGKDKAKENMQPLKERQYAAISDVISNLFLFKHKSFLDFSTGTLFVFTFVFNHCKCHFIFEPVQTFKSRDTFHLNLHSASSERLIFNKTLIYDCLVLNIQEFYALILFIINK